MTCAPGMRELEWTMPGHSTLDSAICRALLGPLRAHHKVSSALANTVFRLRNEGSTEDFLAENGKNNLE